jgi:hypothetical protein
MVIKVRALSFGVFGWISPYPTVVIVVKAQYKLNMYFVLMGLC